MDPLPSRVHNGIERASDEAGMTARNLAAVALLSVWGIAFTIAAPEPAFSQDEPRVVYTKKRPNNRARSRIVVVPRSFLDAGTEVRPGDRKFMDYAYPPTYQPLDVVTNTGGRVGWHRSPLPGPFDLPSRRNPFGW
jgi:hypothetical protein